MNRAIGEAQRAPPSSTRPRNAPNAAARVPFCPIFPCSRQTKLDARGCSTAGQVQSRRVRGICDCIALCSHSLNEIGINHILLFLPSELPNKRWHFGCAKCRQLLVVPTPHLAHSQQQVGGQRQRMLRIEAAPAIQKAVTLQLCRHAQIDVCKSQPTVDGCQLPMPSDRPAICGPVKNQIK